MVRLQGRAEQARDVPSPRVIEAKLSARQAREASAKDSRQAMGEWHAQAEAQGTSERQRKRALVEKVHLEAGPDAQLASARVVSTERAKAADAVRATRAKGDAQTKRDRDAQREATRAVRAAIGDSTARAKSARGQLASSRQADAAEARRKVMEYRQKIRGNKANDHKVKTEAHDAVLEARRFDAATASVSAPSPAPAATERGLSSSSSPSTGLGSPKRSSKKKAAASTQRL